MEHVVNKYNLKKNTYLHTQTHTHCDRPVLLSYMAPKILSHYKEDVTCLWKAFHERLWERGSWASASPHSYWPNIWKKCKLKELKQEVIMPNNTAN